jgi:hypothetical protein
MLVARNDEKSSIGAVSSRVLLATMKAQQAVAIRFVGRRVTTSTCLFFGFTLIGSRGSSAYASRAMRELSQHRLNVVASAAKDA